MDILKRRAATVALDGRSADYSKSMLAALDKSQARIEFTPDGQILEANQNFLKAVGYAAEEVVGKHHSIFVEPAYAGSDEYRLFWDRLKRGEFVSDKFRRFGKGGKEIWIRASYNPILDAAGNTVRVVKFATDITQQENFAIDAGGKISAISKSQAVIEFKPDGTVLTANENFCKTLGYSLDEIRGQHHSMFVESDYARSAEYRVFWQALARGEFQSAKYLRLGKGGKEVWIQASYNPIVGADGKVAKVVKFATDITEQEHFALDAEGKLAAISKSQAVIEFEMDGTILTANENFCAVMGYALSEIRGKHHSMFAEKSYASSPEYRAFWDSLRKGEFQAAKYLRFGKGGKEIWIQASYNPIVDSKGKPYKVVKFASDVTDIENERKAAEKERAARAEEQNVVVKSLASGLKHLSEGNLTERIDQVFAKDYEQLRVDFNAAMSTLQEAMGTIVHTAGGIRGGAGEIAQAADDLSRRTEQQAASLEETAAALDEITATVTKTATGAKQAHSVVATTKSDAEASGEVVRKTVGAMGEIEKSSKQISQIIGVIDEIAFQTNLLALNAGVEAARAGDAGRGFAVVASEVRALAQRSSEAAKEIKGLISASTQHVETGVDLVGEAGKALDLIVTKVAEINDLVSEIAASAQEQSTALGEINSAINQMDQTTQQNAAMVEESTAASHALTQDADGLMQLMSKFETGVSSISESKPAPSRNSPVHAQRERVAKFAATGSAAHKVDDSEWEEF